MCRQRADNVQNKYVDWQFSLYVRYDKSIEVMQSIQHSQYIYKWKMGDRGNVVGRGLRCLQFVVTSK